MKKVIEGNHAISHGVKAASTEVIAAYPITPQTQIVEMLAEMCASGELNATFIKVESEHSAMAAAIGASAAGARAFTATSSQGLLLMHEMLHWAVGARLPVVLANVNRSVGPPWNVWADQNDSLSQRDTGWLQFYCESNQEVFDTVLHAYRTSETVMLPSMLALDAFFLSHTSEIVDVFGADEGKKFLPPYRPESPLTPDAPKSFGNLAGPDSYFELRYKIHEAMTQAVEAAKEADREFARLFGRSYGVIEEYRMEDAEVVLVTSGTVTSTARVVVDAWRERGERVGLLKIRLFRPFPTDDVRRAVAGARKIAVIDRNIGFGIGGIFAQEMKSALWNSKSRVPVFGYIAGIGGRDITPDAIDEVLDRTAHLEAPESEVLWIGLKREQPHLTG